MATGATERPKSPLERFLGIFAEVHAGEGGTALLLARATRNSSVSSRRAPKTAMFCSHPKSSVFMPSPSSSAHGQSTPIAPTQR